MAIDRLSVVQSRPYIFSVHRDNKSDITQPMIMLYSMFQNQPEKSPNGEINDMVKKNGNLFGFQIKSLVVETELIPYKEILVLSLALCMDRFRVPVTTISELGISAKMQHTNRIVNEFEHDRGSLQRLC